MSRAGGRVLTCRAGNRAVESGSGAVLFLVLAVPFLAQVVLLTLEIGDVLVESVNLLAKRVAPAVYIGDPVGYGVSCLLKLGGYLVALGVGFPHSTLLIAFGNADLTRLLALLLAYLLEDFGLLFCPGALSLIGVAGHLFQFPGASLQLCLLGFEGSVVGSLGGGSFRFLYADRNLRELGINLGYLCCVCLDVVVKSLAGKVGQQCLKFRGAPGHVTNCHIACHLQQYLALVLPVESWKVVGIGDALENLRGDDALDGGFVFGLLDGDVVDEIFPFVADELRLNLSALGSPY